MRSREAVIRLSPCDTNFSNPNLQTVEDARAIGRTRCPNLIPCTQRSYRENISCVRRVAQQMAGFVLERIQNGESLQNALDSEIKDYLDNGPDGKLWTEKDGKWNVAKDNNEAKDDIISFTKVILDIPVLPQESNS